MKNRLKTALITALAFCAIAQAAAQQVTVEIDFGQNKPAQTHSVKWTEGMTALTALQYCASIETKPVNEYVFVSDIEGVKNIPTVKAWYYEINGQKPLLLAFRQPIKDGDKIKWIYREDVCSKPKSNGSVTMEIRFGDDERPKQIYNIDWREGLTVMNMLQHYTLVKTTPADGKYIFVSSIDGKRSKAKESFWSYLINGEKAKKIAATQELNEGDYIIWEFRQRDQKQVEPIL